MRTSNKILLAASMLFIISMIIYDFELKVEYQKGDYKNPYRDFVTLNFKDFNAIELDASTAINIMLIKGPFKVMIEPSGREFVHLDQNGSTLRISANFKYGFVDNNRSAYTLYISCPNISMFKSDAKYHYMAGQKSRTDTLSNSDFNWKPTIISGFTQDNLQIKEDNASNVVLENNRIGYLNAVAGISAGSASNLTIGTNNTFNKADLDIRNKSRLWIKGAGKGPLNYHLADSAQLILNGAAKNNLTK